MVKGFTVVFIRTSSRISCRRIVKTPSKAIAALRARMQKVLIPQANKKDLVEIPKYVKRKVKFVPVSSVDEVLKEALVRDPFKPEHRQKTPKGRVSARATRPLV